MNEGSIPVSRRTRLQINPLLMSCRFQAVSCELNCLNGRIRPPSSRLCDCLDYMSTLFNFFVGRILVRVGDDETLFTPTFLLEASVDGNVINYTCYSGVSSTNCAVRGLSNIFSDCCCARTRSREAKKIVGTLLFFFLRH